MITKYPNGFILLNKPYGISSNAAVQRIKHIFHASKAGHTGTLDPLATGMLPICLGEATKFSTFLIDSNKVYQVQAKLGERTSTSDAEGEVLTSSSYVPSLDELKLALKHFTGKQQQIPSMYSALKYKGKPLYKYAREGKEIVRSPRDITVYSILLKSYTYPYLTLEIKVSKGTYIRTLIEDIGKYLTSEAYVKSLHRVSVHNFSKNLIVELQDLENSSHEYLLTKILPITRLLDFSCIQLTAEESTHILYGREISYEFPYEDTLLQLFVNQNFIGLGIYQHHTLRPRRLISTL